MTKKYIGNGNESNFGVNAEINLNQLFNFLNEKSENVDLKSTFKTLVQVLKKTDFYRSYKDKDGKEFHLLKIAIDKRKNPEKYKTHNVSLNEYVPKNTVNQDVKTEKDDEF